MRALFINGTVASLEEQHWHNFHGSSVFTTLRSHLKKPIFFDDHWERVRAHACHFGFNTPDKEAVHSLINKQLGLHDQDQKIRIIISERDYALTFEPYMPPPCSVFLGVSVEVAQTRVHPDLYWLKTGNSLPYQLALKEAQAKGAFEALLLDHKGYLADGSRTGLLLMEQQNAVIVSGGLESIMRKKVVEYLSRIDVPIVERALMPHEVSGQLLLTNSLMGVIPVGPPQTKFIEHLIETFKNGVPNESNHNHRDDPRPTPPFGS